MKQIFKSRELTTTKVVNNILIVYNQSTDFSNWYKDAHEFAMNLAVEYQGILPKDATLNARTSIVCGVIASLSPLKSWDENKKITITLLQGGKAKHTKAMAAKAHAILQSSGEPETICDILNGNKITSFYLNLYEYNTSQVVTIDRHAISIALNEVITDNYQMTNKQYEFFQNCYRVASIKLNVLPLQVQSVTWVRWRIAKKRINEVITDESPF